VTTGFMPGALAKLIAPGTNDPSITPCGVVLHVRDGLGDSLHDFFDGPSGGIESHFYVRFDGTIEQYRSVWFEADAQLLGNSFMLGGKRVGFVSVETEGRGAGTWTAQQLTSIKAIILWVRSQAEFPLEPCPAWNKPGVGYHTMWGSPSPWTPVAKSCPGPDRIKQFHAVIEPWMAEASQPPRRLFRVQHRIVTANMFVKNAAPASGIGRIVARVVKAFALPPDVIAVQEGQRMLDELEEIDGYNTFVDKSDGEASKEIPVLLRDRWKSLGTEYHHAADGTSTGTLDHARGIFVVKYSKRGSRCAVVNTHMGLFADEADLESGKRRPGPAAQQHAAHAQKVVRIARRLEANGYVVHVTADANARGVWSQSLPAVLAAAGMHVTRHGVDLIASSSRRTRFKQQALIPHEQTGSDVHDAIAIRTIEKRKP